jgi:hypothetical protein
MHNAPPVSYSAESSVVYATVLAALWGLGLAALCWWYWTAGAWSLRHSVTGITLLLASGLAARSVMRLGKGELRWTGSAWTWTATATSSTDGALAVHLDWQRGMLLSFTSFQGRRVWLCMAQSAQPLRWHALRCAVYSRATGTSAQAPT